MRSLNFKIIIIALLINAIGIFTIYSSVFPKESAGNISTFLRQIIWVILSLSALLLVYRLDYQRLWDAVYFIYGITVFLLILVLVLGIVRLGAQRWLKFLWFNFQPSELAKLATVIFLARYFSCKSVSSMDTNAKNYGIFDGIVKPFLVIAVPMLLILIQPDLGSSLMLFFIFVSMLYISGLRLKNILGLLATFLALSPFLWNLLKAYQKERLLVFINPNIDPLGAGYTIIQSKIAIGSGGWFGKGWLSGTQSQLRFLPESHTDFIFATFTEEWGFMGGIILIFLYFMMIIYCLQVAAKTNDNFGKLLASGIASMFAIQIIINIAMTIGFAPVVGLPLVFMSYGGSSVLITYISLGILLSINRKRSIF
jgi:rod shape determining protein RodA